MITYKYEQRQVCVSQVELQNHVQLDRSPRNGNCSMHICFRCYQDGTQASRALPHFIVTTAAAGMADLLSLTPGTMVQARGMTPLPCSKNCSLGEAIVACLLSTSNYCAMSIAQDIGCSLPPSGEPPACRSGRVTISPRRLGEWDIPAGIQSVGSR